MRAAVVARPLDAVALLAAVGSSTQGASVLFIGTVRDMNDGRSVTALDYRAYTPMAERELVRIIDEAELAWPGAHVACEHRIGALALGDASVIVAASHPHRAEAFEACRFVIEQLKLRLPVWKREHYADGDLAWVENTIPQSEMADAE
jgi:molybdopterin synthase catalytic subunit